MSLINHSDYSLKDGMASPESIASTYAAYGYDHCAITEHGNLSSSVEFVQACKSHKIKPILGCEFQIKDRFGYLTVLAKGQKGWQALVKANAAAQLNFRKTPLISLEELADCSNNDFIIIDGYLNSLLYESAATDTHIFSLYEYFGKNNVYIGVHGLASINIEKLAELNTYYREKEGIQRVAVNPTHYCRKKDAPDHRILLCAALNSSLKNLSENAVKSNKLDINWFLSANDSYILTKGQLSDVNTDEEIDNVGKIVEECGTYNILNKPLLPKLSDQDDELFVQKVRDGWKNKVIGKIDKTEIPNYTDRVKKEMDVLKGAGLSTYFLIVQEYVNFARSQGWIVGNRGSGTGCLVSYLMDITDIDPIPNGLIFERFYNAGRNTKDKISLPDIDCDFPKSKRDLVKDHAIEKYGKGKVSDIPVFGSLQGRGAIKTVLRATGRASFDEMNEITKYIPDEARISDQLNEMMEERGYSSIIQWALENSKKELRQWCFINDNGEYDGEFAADFSQARKLEGVRINQGRHASGVIISSVDINDSVPTIFDEHLNAPVLGYEMNSAEAAGLVKFDILGSTVLDKIMDCVSFVKTGECNE